MKIIKNKQIIEDNWTHIADEDVISNGDITISLDRWKKQQSDLKHHRGNIGIRLSPSDIVESIAEDLDKAALVVLEFPVFTDGRPFSQARILRSKYKFEGEVRAIGNYMPDQVFYLSRVGVNAFQLENPEQLSLALSTMNDFTVKYQSSSDCKA